MTAARPMTREDLADVRAIISAADLFPADMIDAMAEPALSGQEQALWFVIDDDKRSVAVSYTRPEDMTDGTQNTLLLAVHPECQGKGLGSQMMAHIETVLGQSGNRILLVETSDSAAFARTRAFYHGLGYDHAAEIPEFYQAGEGKVIFLKRLTDS